MSIEYGSLADWVGALGGLLAVGAATVAWGVSKRLLAVEQSRDANLAAADVSSQAELVFVLGAKLKSREGLESWAIYIYNGSDKPLYDVSIDSQRLDGGARNLPLELGAVPPGKFVVPRHREYYWDSLVDLSLAPEAVDYLVKGKGTNMVVRAVFCDAARRRWELVKGTELRRLQ